MDVISCMKWLPREYAEHDFFTNYITKELEEDEEEADSEGVQVDKTTEDDEIVKLFDLDEYDNDDFYPNQQILDISKSDEKFFVEDQDDIDARVLTDDDRIVITGHTNDDLSSIIVYLYDSGTCGLEPIHSIPIDTFPLCCELIIRNNELPLISMGTFNSSIHSWNIHELNNLAAVMVLEVGGDVATLSISQSKHVNELLASGHSDNIVRIWDLSECTTLHKFTHHDDKVQSVVWDKTDPSLLITGSFDKTISLIDVRRHDPINTVKLKSDVETIDCGKDSIIVGSENGTVCYYDRRNLNKALWEINSHKGPCSSLCIKEDILVTCGLDCNANVYNINSNRPKLIKCKNLKAGQLFTSSYSLDDETLYSFGGSSLVIWDINY